MPKKTFNATMKEILDNCASFYGRCPEGIGRHNVKMSFLLSFFLSFFLSFCHVTFSSPLIGQKTYRRSLGR